MSIPSRESPIQLRVWRSISWRRTSSSVGAGTEGLAEGLESRRGEAAELGVLVEEEKGSIAGLERVLVKLIVEVGALPEEGDSRGPRGELAGRLLGEPLFPAETVPRPERGETLEKVIVCLFSSLFLLPLISCCILPDLRVTLFFFLGGR